MRMLDSPWRLRILVAARLKECFHPEDCFARYGGEEFVAVLVETPHVLAAEMAELVRDLVAEIPSSTARRFAR